MCVLIIFFVGSTLVIQSTFLWGIFSNFIKNKDIYGILTTIKLTSWMDSQSL